MKKCICFILTAIFIVLPIHSHALETGAGSVILIDGNTLEILYSRDARKRNPMASTTKIMTALLLCEQGDLSKRITVKKEELSVEGSSMGLSAGDSVTFSDLLYGLMLVSGNDAANVIACKIGGSIENFVRMMNSKAETLGLYNTHFNTPSGLDGKSHYTTAEDLALLTAFALKNPVFAETVSTKVKTLHYGNPPEDRILTNHNKLLNDDGIVGVKTGYTKKAGRCLVSAYKKTGRYFIAVTLNCSDDWHTHRELIRYGCSVSKPVIVSDRKVYKIKPSEKYCDYIKSFKEKAIVQSETQQDINTYTFLPDFLYLPVKSGETVGYSDIYSDGKLIKRNYIYSEKDRKSMSKITFKNNLFYILSFI